jgi:hypothetical protein
MKNHLLVLLLSLCVLSTSIAQNNDSISLKVQKYKDKVEVRVNGELFTAYSFDPSLEKPILFPVHAPDGTIVTRGYPIAPRSKERVDHPHHVGLWFNFGDVNGFDFWNNSYAVGDDHKGAYGRIIHRSIEKAETSGKDGLLEVKMDWMAPDNEQAEKLLEESTTFIFRAENGAWIVDRITRLTAAKDKVIFTDNKEGMLAIRVDRAFEHPSDNPVIFTDKSGKSSGEAVLDNRGVTGWYRNSEGDEGLAAWGKNAAWVELTGTKDSSDCTLVLMDHPKNINYPACWHARGYGLFSVNNLGRQVYNRKLEKFQLVLNKGESISFRHRFVVSNGKLSHEEVEKLYADFISETTSYED